jgi:formyltetrahydrofolate-dependent phosphoribosylglycinamide formyltransferase
MKFIVLCSSRGTVFQSTIDRMNDGSLTARCLGLVCDREDRGCVQKAKTNGIPVKIVTMKKGEPRDAYDKRVHAAILKLIPADSAQNCVIACMGWMWILSAWFVSQWRNRIINVHPALLPKHKGAHAHELVLASKDRESGMTIHLVDEGVDTGKILLQKKCPVLPDDTVDTLKARVQMLETQWYPTVLQMIEQGEIRLT